MTRQRINMSCSFSSRSDVQISQNAESLQSGRNKAVENMTQTVKPYVNFSSVSEQSTLTHHLRLTANIIPIISHYEISMRVGKYLYTIASYHESQYRQLP